MKHRLLFGALALVALCSSVVWLEPGMASATGGWSGTGPTISGAFGECNLEVHQVIPPDSHFTFPDNGWSVEYACQYALTTGSVAMLLDNRHAEDAAAGTNEVAVDGGSPGFFQAPYGSGYTPDGTCGVGRVYWWGIYSTTLSVSDHAGTVCTPPFTPVNSHLGPSAAISGGMQGEFAGNAPSNFASTGTLMGFGEITGATYGTTVTSGRVAVEITGWVTYPTCDATAWGLNSTYGTTYGDQCPGANESQYEQGMFGNSTTHSCTGPGYGTYTPSVPSVGPALYVTGGAGSAEVTAQVDNVVCGDEGDAGPSMPTDVYTGGVITPPSTPCQLVSATGDAGQAGNGSRSFPSSVKYTGPAQILLMDPMDGAATSLTLHGASFSADSVVNFHPSDPWNLSYVTQTGSTVGQEVFWCYDAGTWYWGSSIADLVPIPPVPSAFNLGQCLSDALGSMSLTDPVSWVTGIGSTMGCVLQWLFIPDPSAVSGLSTDFGVNSSTPSIGTDSASQWLGSFVAGVGAMPGAALTSIKSAADGGTCALPGDPNFSIGGHTFNGCNAVSGIEPGNAPTSDGNTALGVLRDFLTAGFYLEVTIGLFMFMRKVLSAGS